MLVQIAHMTGERLLAEVLGSSASVKMSGRDTLRLRHRQPRREGSLETLQALTPLAGNQIWALRWR